MIQVLRLPYQLMKMAGPMSKSDPFYRLRKTIEDSIKNEWKD